MRSSQQLFKLKSISTLILVVGMALAIYGIYQSSISYSLSNNLNSTQQNLSFLKRAYSSLNAQFNSAQTQYLKNLTILNNSYSDLQRGYNTLNQKYSNLKEQTTNPYSITLASNKEVTVPQMALSIPFYSSTLQTYNNYTVTGNYDINFTAPYDGYLLLYLISTNAQNGTYQFQAASNTSRIFYFNAPTFHTINICILYSNCPSTFRAEADYVEVPNTTAALYVIPILRGNATFEIMNANPYPISINFSLEYIGEPFANLSIDTAYR